MSSVAREPLRFGANYVPSMNWFYSWMDWNLDSVRRDLEAIADLGLDHIRAHLLWSYFQPSSSVVSPIAVCRLLELLDAADEVGLDVAVTVLNGWLSGFEFYPAWMHRRNMVTDRHAVDAQLQLFSGLAEACVHHRRFLGFDIGNELSYTLVKSHPCTLEEADTWQAELLSHCENLAPGRLHVNGVDHIPYFYNHSFTRSALASAGSATSLHSWTGFTGALDRYGPLGIGSVYLTDYMTQLAKAHHQDPKRKVWIQEFGIAEEWLKGADPVEFADRTFEVLTSLEYVWGATWWCSHDIDRGIAGFGEMEYGLGLLTVGNEVKPLGAAVKRLVEHQRLRPAAIRERTTALPVSTDAFSNYGNWNSGWRIAESFFDLIALGEYPTLYLQTA